MFVRHTPAAPLDAFVACLWSSEREALPHARERNLPTGRADLIFALRQDHLSRFADANDAVGLRFRGAVIQGPQERALFRDTSEPSSVVGVHFHPGGASALLGVPMTELAGRTLALDDLWGTRADAFRDQLRSLPDAPSRLRCLEVFLLTRLSRTVPANDDAAIAWALQRFHARGDAGSVESVRAALGWSPRRFIAQFSMRVGLAPKRYCRLHRFQSVVHRLAQGRSDQGWAQLASEAGYADQAHMIREFRTFSGLTPGRYRAIGSDQANHVAVTPEKIFNTRPARAATLGPPNARR